MTSAVGLGGVECGDTRIYSRADCSDGSFVFNACPHLLAGLPGTHRDFGYLNARGAQLNGFFAHLLFPQCKWAAARTIQYRTVVNQNQVFDRLYPPTYSQIMYLAVKHLTGKPAYVIRESYHCEDHYRSRDLFDLGADPTKYIVYPGGNAFFIDEMVEERLTENGARLDGDELETIFWPFLKPEIQRALDCFRNRELSLKAQRRGQAQALESKDFHLFDRRRLHFLKYGQMNQRRLNRLPFRMLVSLYHKSRDEIEQSIFQMERVLRPRELKAYVYVIFDLQRYFSEHFARERPEFLNQSEVDNYFLDTLCRLNSDSGFWAGMDACPWLATYLHRYLFMYFDNDFASRSLEQDFIRRFMNAHRGHQHRAGTYSVSLKEAAQVFSKSEAELRKMDRSDLARLFRRKAQTIHPDKGGDHKAFVKLTEAYQRLVATKR